MNFQNNMQDINKNIESTIQVQNVMYQKLLTV